GGAGGGVGAAEAARAAPDGYTLFFPSGSVVTANQHIYAKLNYDPEKDFVPVTNVVSGPQVLVVPAGSPYKSVRALVDAAKASPGDHQQDRSASASRRAADREHAAGLRERRLVRHRGAHRHAEGDHRQGVSGHEEGARYDRDESALLRAGAGAGRQFAGRVRRGDEGRDRALGERGEGAQHPRPVKIDLRQVEEAAKELYIRALKRLPPDVKQGFDALAKSETDAGARRMLGTMIRNIGVAENTATLLCTATGTPIYNVWIGRGVEVDGVGLPLPIRRR